MPASTATKRIDRCGHFVDIVIPSIRLTIDADATAQDKDGVEPLPSSSTGISVIHHRIAKAMLSRFLQRRLNPSSLRKCHSQPSPSSIRARDAQRRWMTPAPKPGDGPLMSRRADRELPELSQVKFRWARSLPIFIAVVTICSLAIFNYQKTSSPIVSSTLYALRTNARARSILGDDIYFKHQIPWIRGQMNAMQGRIDIYFTVRGNKGWATMRFASHRPSSRSLFETTEWSLTTEQGEWVDLLDGGDPFRGLGGDAGLAGLADDERDENEMQSTRGFRQQGVMNK
ncbi:hypothetical protein E4U21_000012 [Claviceps maximensis]|nr:hypothetical protein E4U21_000012 [Claviceps maximensis]